MAKRKKDNTLLLIGAAVVGYYLYAQWKKKQPQTKPANKRFMPGESFAQSIDITNANGNLKNPFTESEQLPQFPYVVKVKSISGLKLM